jgi:LacI family transcriptional regulator
MQDVAERAGVAVSSVSRVLADHPDVSDRMRTRVLNAVNALGYQPDFVAQSLRRGATLTVGFVVGDISNPLLADAALGAESILRRAGFSMLLMNSENNPALDAAHIRFFVNRRVDGMILSLASERRKETVDVIASLDIPVVLVDRELPARARASAVLSDHRSAVREAAEHLIKQGARNIAIIAGPTDTRPGRERIAGMREGMRGSSAELTVNSGAFSGEHGREAMTELLNLRVRPDAVVLGSNQIAVGALRVLHEQGVRSGRDIAIVVCDQTPLQELLAPPLSTIWRDSVELGRAAAELLLDRLRGDKTPATRVLPTRFVPRESSRLPRQRGSNQIA